MCIAGARAAGPRAAAGGLCVATADVQPHPGCVWDAVGVDGPGSVSNIARGARLTLAVRAHERVCKELWSGVN